MLSPISILLLLPVTISAVTFDCDHVRVDKVKWDLSKLGGPKEVHQIRPTAPQKVSNTTFTLDICKTLKKPEDPDERENFCSTGTRVCAVERIYGPDGSMVAEVTDIAGQYTMNGRGDLDPKYTRLKNSASHSDAASEGVRVELHGGRSEANKKQSAIIEFVCDPDWEGTEGFEAEREDVNSFQYGSMHKRGDSKSEVHPKVAEDGDDEDDGPGPDDGKALQFLSYEDEGKTKVLRLSWKTKHACENAVNEPDPEDGKKGGSWGFFTWLIIIAFLLAAAYIIFGSWLNYNRYGARGWDLIPHGDTIRDLPYIVKDWGTGVMDKLRGGGSRGGYSAV